MKQTQIDAEEILPKTYEDDFKKKAPSEDIALIRYEHYLIRRNSKYQFWCNFVKEKLKKLQETMQLANSYGTLEAIKPTPQSR